MSRALACLAIAALAAAAVQGCAVSPDESGESSTSNDALSATADAEWFYDGPLTPLTTPTLTVSLAANTLHVIGYLPAIPDGAGDLPNVKLAPDSGGKVRVDIVYPIATAANPSANSRPGTYTFYEAMPYRPNGGAYTPELGEHQVTWGGFPFLGYNDGIAFHGPITSELGNGGSEQVWYLRRGHVSSGCNRMNGEHVVELAHILGVSMRKLYAATSTVPPPSSAKVTVIADYDQHDGKYIDTDYATDVGVVRPGTKYGGDKVEMFGSWLATQTPDGKDLAPDMKWEGGVNGKPYVFAEHARANMVCSYPKSSLPALKKLAATYPNSELPRGVCAKHDCILGALTAQKDAKATCGI